MYDNFQKTNRHNIAFLWSNWPILVAFILFYQIIAKTVHFILNVYFEYVLRSKHEKYFVLYVMNQIWSIKQDKKGPNYVTSIPSIVAPVCIYKVAGNPVVVVSIGHWLFLMFNWTPIVSISAQPSAIQLDLATRVSSREFNSHCVMTDGIINYKRVSWKTQFPSNMFTNQSIVCTEIPSKP